MNFNDSKLEDTLVGMPSVKEHTKSIETVAKQVLKPFVHHIKLLEDQIKLRDLKIEELKARLKHKKYHCLHPDCGWYFDTPKTNRGGFTTCPICGALNYEKVKYPKGKRKG